MSLQSVVEIVTSEETLYFAQDAMVNLSDDTSVVATDINSGDSIAIAANSVITAAIVQSATIVEVLDVLAANSSRITTLEKTLAVTNDTLMNIQRSIVELTANHIDRIFSDPIMVDTLAHRMAIASANAISFKVKSSQHRTPELVVIEQAIPGAIRVTLQENGETLIEEQLKDTGEWASGDQLSEAMQSETITEVFGNLLVSYGAQVGRAYFVVEDVHLEVFRKDAAKSAKAALDTAVGAAAPVAEEGQSEPATTTH